MSRRDRRSIPYRFLLLKAERDEVFIVESEPPFDPASISVRRELVVGVADRPRIDFYPAAATSCRVGAVDRLRVDFLPLVAEYTP